MTGLPDWPDTEAMLADLLGDLAPVVTRTGTDLAQVLPRIRVTRIGGSDDRVTDVARIAVVVYAADPDQAKTIAGQARQRITAPGGWAVASGIADHGVTESAPAGLGTNDPAQTRAVSAIYRISLRRRTSAA